MPITTQQRVTQKSAELFNAYGVEAISIGQISEEIGISPGNFTYYYKKKSELIDDHFSKMELNLANIIDNLPIHASPREFSVSLYRLLDLIYDYRFIFLGTAYLVKNDLLPLYRYTSMIEAIRLRIVRQVDRMIAEGHMKPVEAPFTTELLVETMWWQWLGWLLALQMAPRTVSQSRLITEALRNILFVNQSYVDRIFFRAMRAELQRTATSSDGKRRPKRRY